MNIIIYSILFMIVIVFKESHGSDKNIVSARIESCPGCSLNRLSEVKKFIYEDVPKYENVEFVKIHGAVPELILLNNADEEVERLQLSRLNRKECNELLFKYGFNKKPQFSKEEF